MVLIVCILYATLVNCYVLIELKFYLDTFNLLAIPTHLQCNQPVSQSSVTTTFIDLQGLKTIKIKY